MPGCNWTSFRTSDPAQLEGCVLQYRTHLQYDHGNAGESSQEEFSFPRSERSDREYKLATQKRSVQRVTDDGLHNLSDARFFAAPLDFTVLGNMMPTAISPVNTVVDFSHLGVRVVNQDILRKVHNRANPLIRLKDFHKPNLEAYHHPGDELTALKVTDREVKLGRKQKPLETAQDCVLAFLNYLLIMGQYHVLETSPKALFLVVLEKFFEGPPSPQQFIALFDKYIQDSAIRAQKKTSPLSYDEIKDIWTHHIAPSPVNMGSISALLDKKIKEQLNLSTTSSLKRKVNGKSNKNNLPKVQKIDKVFCPDFTHFGIKINYF